MTRPRAIRAFGAEALYLLQLSGSHDIFLDKGPVNTRKNALG